MHALCGPLSALCLMSLALRGPVRFYLLFVSDIWWWVVSWFVHVLLPSSVICKHLLRSGNLLCASCMPSALHSSALCLMSLALCGPGGFYILFVSGHLVRFGVYFHMGQSHKGQHNECEKAGVSEVMGGI